MGISCKAPLVGYRSPTGKIVFKLAESYTDVKGIAIPCGQCIQCRLEKARQWALRIMHETQGHDISSFITLTYRDDCLPVGGSLIKTDIQRFFKRLRKSIYPEKLRYYAVGEYGGQTQRPHYHAVIFGYRPPDCKEYGIAYNSAYGTNARQNKLYTSKTLDSTWGKGACMIGSVDWESASYVARYVVDKITGDMAVSYYHGRIPEFSLMSRRPGIGGLFYEKYQNQLWRHDYVVMNGKKMRPPKRYEKYLELTDPERLKKLKAERRIKLKQTGLITVDSMSREMEIDWERCLNRDKIATTKANLYKKKSI
ncbi:replication associated protein [Microviridae sp.]|nr:replication associated protein [Microviridae sp.]